MIKMRIGYKHILIKIMSSQEYLNMMKDIQENFLKFLEGITNSEENFLILESYKNK